MHNYFKILFFITLFLVGCSEIPSTDEIEGDIGLLETEIQTAMETTQEYSGGLLAVLAKTRLEALKTTKTMLDQKKTGFKRYIPVSYSIDGKEYFPPENKNELLLVLQEDINNLKENLSEAENESAKYRGGLLSVLSLTKVATVKNSITFLEQRMFLLKHDIPYYSVISAKPGTSEPHFKPTPGKDIDKF